MEVVIPEKSAEFLPNSVKVTLYGSRDVYSAGLNLCGT